MPENKGKYNIDDLVNSLLMERQPEMPLTAPELDVIEEDGTDNPDILEISEELLTENEEEWDDTPSQLLDFEALAEVSVAASEEKEVDIPAVSPVVEPLPEPEIITEVPKADVLPRDNVPVQPIVPAEEPALPEEPAKKRKKWFSRRQDTATLSKEWVDYGLKPIGQYRVGETRAEQDTKVIPAIEPKQEEVTPIKAVQEAPASEKRRSMDEFPAVKVSAETITMQVVLPSGMALPRSDKHTRIVPDVSRSAEEVRVTPPSVAEPVLPIEEQLPDQLSLEEMVRVEDIESPEGVSEEAVTDPEEHLQRAREEKVRAFTLDGDEEEENEPEDEVVAQDEPEIEDFTGYQDTQTVAAELKYRCRSALWSVLLTAVLTFGMLVLTLLTVIAEHSPISSMGYLLVHLFGVILMMGLNYATVTRGLSGLFTLRANNDTAPALAATVCLVNVIAHLFNAAAPLPYWTPLAGLLLLFSAAAHYKQEVCIRRNFAFVSYPGDKYAAALIEDESALQEIGRRAVSDGEAKVAYFRRTGFLTDYLANAYEADGGDDWSRWLTPSAFGLSLLLSLLSLLSQNVTGALGWLSVFTGMICLSMPVTLLAVQTPLSGSCRRMVARGGFINGWKAVRCFGQPDALAVDIADLYPDESMLLHGIKTFSGAHIDEAILTAASLAVRAGGPLAMIFRRIIENKEELLLEVDSLVYEQGMGLSGWVDGRRVFVGNGRLLENHGVDIPSADYEARYAKDGRRLVYLAIAGQLSAMFVVSYLPDPEIQSALEDLCRSRVTLLVRSCDPNITTSDLCASFGLDEYYVDVLPAAAGRQYVQLTEKVTDSLPAVMASNGHILGMARALSICRGLQAKAVIALIVQTIFVLLGLILGLLWTMNGTLSLFQPLLLLLASAFLTWFIPLFKRA